MTYGKSPQQVVDFYKEAMRRIDALPGVIKTAFGVVASWRDADIWGYVCFAEQIRNLLFELPAVRRPPVLDYRRVHAA